MTVQCADAGVEPMFALALACGALLSAEAFFTIVQAARPSYAQMHARPADGPWFEYVGVAALVVASHLCTAEMYGGLLRVRPQAVRRTASDPKAHSGGDE